jgi:ABC-type uncharacterized transport system ATPase component
MLEHYRAMASLSRQMLAAARQADWPLLIELGQQRDAVEEQLHGALHGEAGGEQEQQLLAALLAANEQIKLLVDAHLASLQPAAGDAG